MRKGKTLILLAAVMTLWQSARANALPDIAESDDFFGFSTAAGDFNNDGFADLAVGVPYEEVGGIARAGAVNVLYGSTAGLNATGSQLWHKGSQDIAGDPFEDDHFGWALATGDFNGDGYSDLAVGVPSENVCQQTPSPPPCPDGINILGDAGAVYVLYGSSGGLSGTGSQVWHQDSPGIPDDAEIGDFFGASLAAANFGNGSQADLAVGSYGESVGAVFQAGAVYVLYGSSGGLSGTGSQVWHQDSPGIPDDAETGDFFGLSLAAANFGNGSQADLAVGVPYEDVGAVTDAGAVNVIYGS